MKFVSLIVIATLTSFGAFAQTTGTATKKETVGQMEQKNKKQNSKSSGKEVVVGRNGETLTLKDEKDYKAKSSFEQMLMRRLEIDAEAGERERQQRKG